MAGKKEEIKKLTIEEIFNKSAQEQRINQMLEEAIISQATNLAAAKAVGRAEGIAWVMSAAKASGMIQGMTCWAKKVFVIFSKHFLVQNLSSSKKLFEKLMILIYSLRL